MESSRVLLPASGVLYVPLAYRAPEAASLAAAATTRGRAGEGESEGDRTQHEVWNLCEACVFPSLPPVPFTGCVDTAASARSRTL